MGTRADFYVGRNPRTMLWLGSVALDGYPQGCPRDVVHAETFDGYYDGVMALLQRKRHATRPEQGWPWPWPTSDTTDFAYTFDQGQVLVSRFGRAWQTMHWYRSAIPEDYDAWRKVPGQFPDMTERSRVTFGRRSGVLFVGMSP